MPETRSILRHAILSIAWVIFFLLLNRPEVILLSHIGLVMWYPASGLVMALLLGVSPWYAFLIAISGSLAGVVIYHEPILSYSQTLDSFSTASLYAGAAYILRGPLRIDLSLRQRRDVVRYLLVTTVAAVCSSVVGVACLAADRAVAWDHFGESFAGWFFGDEVGLLAVAPFLLIHVHPWLRRKLSGDTEDSPRAGTNFGQLTFTLQSTLEAIGQMLGLIGVLWLMFGPRWEYLQLYYLSFVPILWIAMRHGIWRAVTGLLVLDFGIAVALHWYPFSGSLGKVGLLMFAVSASGLIVGSAVSERHRLAIELQEQTVYLNSLIQSNPLGIVVLNRNGRIELANAAFGSLFQCTPGQILGIDIQQIFPADPEVQPSRSLPEVTEGDKVEQKSIRRRRRDGEMLDLELQIVPVIAGGRVHGSYTIYKDISQQARAQEQERQHAESLQGLVKELEVRTSQMALLNEMGNLLECCTTVEEATPVVIHSVHSLFRDMKSGTLFMFKSSRNLVEAAASWPDLGASEGSFVPDACWALRRGQPHWSEAASPGTRCSHLAKELLTECLCVPLIGRGDTLGVLHLEFPATQQQDDNHKSLRLSQQILGIAISTQVALSLANLRLQETLRDQSIRDPLTGLFNRRFMHESLNREILRARRKDHPLSVLFLDLDHFKRFNDTFGHDAGDFVLRSLSDVFRSFFRADDVICRQGGEEFAFILPESSSQDSVLRANGLREKVKETNLVYEKQLLGTVTLSIGVASFPEHSSDPEELLKLADKCLYESKSGGRDRVTVATAARSRSHGAKAGK